MKCDRFVCDRCIEYAEIRDGRCYCNEGYFRFESETVTCKSCEDSNEFLSV